jgi:aryl-alcohol dehydrogenase-like predicted oxidoreductase
MTAPAPYRNFGRTGAHISPLGLGCMTFGGKTPQPEADRMVARAVETGVNFFDTSNSYGRGASEEALGRALQAVGGRDRLLVATKVHHKTGDGPNRSGNSRRHLLEQCDASLRRLRTDWIDLYQIHRPLSDTPIDETLGALDDLIRAGKVRYAGTSCFAAWQIVESLMVSRERRLNRFVCEQAPLNLLDRSLERDLLPMAQTWGTAVIVFGPLAGGLLTGKYTRGSPPPAGTRYATPIPNPNFNRRLEPGQPWWDAFEKLRPFAAAKGVSLANFALAWVRQQPGVTCTLVGPRTLEQLDDNLASLSITFTPAELAAVDEVVPPGGQTVPYYEVASPLAGLEGKNFGPHLHRI